MPQLGNGTSSAAFRPRLLDLRNRAVGGLLISQSRFNTVPCTSRFNVLYPPLSLNTSDCFAGAVRAPLPASPARGCTHRRGVDTAPLPRGVPAQTNLQPFGVNNVFLANYTQYAADLHTWFSPSEINPLTGLPFAFEDPGLSKGDSRRARERTAAAAPARACRRRLRSPAPPRPPLRRYQFPVFISVSQTASQAQAFLNYLQNSYYIDEYTASMDVQLISCARRPRCTRT